MDKCYQQGNEPTLTNGYKECCGPNDRYKAVELNSKVVRLLKHSPDRGLALKLYK